LVNFVDKTRQPFDEGALFVSIGQVEAERRGREFYFARRLGAGMEANGKKERDDTEANKQIHRFEKFLSAQNAKMELEF